MTVNRKLNKHNILADIRKPDATSTLTQDDNDKADVFNDFFQVCFVRTMA